jgi:hypothetical protein
VIVSGGLDWGFGSFKETNKRNVILVVNWGAREFYAFKYMEEQLVQGGHFFLALS